MARIHSNNQSGKSVKKTKFYKEIPEKTPKWMSQNNKKVYPFPTSEHSISKDI